MPPSITSLTVSPSAIEVGGQASVQVVAINSDGDTTLTAKWSATFGKFAPSVGMKALYTNTEPATADVITVFVSNSAGQQTQASAVVAFTNPPPGAAKPSPSPGPSPEASPTPGPNGTPRPSPKPSPSPANQPPTVTVSAAGTSCHPLPSSLCSVTLTAAATDPDGDPIAYSWSGCASGSGTTASCSVTSISTFTGTVTVSDNRGGSGSATASVQGVNDTPTIASVFWLQGRGPLAENTDATLEFQVTDDDTTSSACAPTKVYRMCVKTGSHCNGRTGYVDVHITSGTGTRACTIDFQWTDPWGASVKGTGSINVQ